MLVDRSDTVLLTSKEKSHILYTKSDHDFALLKTTKRSDGCTEEDYLCTGCGILRYVLRSKDGFPMYEDMWKPNTKRFNVFILLLWLLPFLASAIIVAVEHFYRSVLGVLWLWTTMLLIISVVLVVLLWFGYSSWHFRSNHYQIKSGDKDEK